MKERETVKGVKVGVLNQIGKRDSSREVVMAQQSFITQDVKQFVKKKSYLIPYYLTSHYFLFDAFMSIHESAQVLNFALLRERIFFFFYNCFY